MTAKTSVRFEFLDALRGIAAIYVLLFHLSRYNCGPQLVVNGLLSVDFFFILSGLVIASAYQGRLLDGMTFPAFVRVRAIRLLPMSILSVVLGSLFIVIHQLVGDVNDSVSGSVAAFALNLFLIPKLWYENWSGYQLFPGNGPLWSLFFEVVINLVWAAFLVRASNRVLAIVAAAGGLLLVCEVMSTGTANLGWSSLSLVGGFARVTFGFTAGVLIYRYHHRLQGPPKLCAAFALLLLSVVVIYPVETVGWWLPGMLILLPASVAFGAVAAGTPILPGEKLLGRLSYPIYAIHMPIVHFLPGIQKRLFGTPDTGAAGLLWAIPIIFAAWLALTFYDEPVRAWLGRRGKKRAATNADKATGTPLPRG